MIGMAISSRTGIIQLFVTRTPIFKNWFAISTSIP